MPSTLTDLPPELVLRILSQLSLRPLLEFSLASNTCCTFSRLSLRRLSFGIFPTRLSSHISHLSASTTLRDIINEHWDRHIIPEENCVSLVIPEVDVLDIVTQIAFHDALNGAILNRYALGLRVLDLSIWRMDQGIANALAKLGGLQKLTLKVENPFFRRRISRTDEMLLREDKGMWGMLAGVWTRLQVLQLVGASTTAEELLDIISENDGLTELWLTRCDRLARDVLRMLNEWEVCPQLKYLGVVESPTVVKKEHLQCLQHFRNLEVFSIEGCKCPDAEEVETMNEEVWKIPHFIFPHATTSRSDAVSDEIAVDPTYLSSESFLGSALANDIMDVDTT